MKTFKVKIYYQSRKSTRHNIIANSETEARKIVMNFFTLMEEDVRHIEIKGEIMVVE